MWMLWTQSQGIASSIQAKKLHLNSILLASVGKTDPGLFIKYRMQIASTFAIFCHHLQWQYKRWAPFVQLISWEELRGERWMKDLAYSPSPQQYTHHHSCHRGSKSKNGTLAVPEHQGQFSTTPVIPILQILSQCKEIMGLKQTADFKGTTESFIS